MEYVLKRRVVKTGNNNGSLIVNLPKIWAEAHGVKAGQEVLMAFGNYGYLKVYPSTEKLEEKSES